MNKYSTPAISVLTPIYKHDIKIVKQCLESLKAQSIQDIEFILIDNGATKDSKELINKYVNLDKRFKSICIPINQGYGKAMNLGLKTAKGEYIGIVESDDYVEPCMYETLYNLAKENNAQIVKSFFKTIIGNSVMPYFDATNCIISEDLLPKLILNNHISQWSAIYNKKMLEENQIEWSEEKGAHAQDIPFVLKAYFSSERIYITDKVLYNYRNHSESATVKAMDENAYGNLVEYRNLSKWLNQRNNIKKQALEIKICREFRSLFYIGYKEKITHSHLKFLNEFSLNLKENKNESFVFFTNKEKKYYKLIKNSPLIFYIYYRLANFFDTKVQTKIKLIKKKFSSLEDLKEKLQNICFKNISSKPLLSQNKNIINFALNCGIKYFNNESNIIFDKKYLKNFAKKYAKTKTKAKNHINSLKNNNIQIIDLNNNVIEYNPIVHFEKYKLNITGKNNNITINETSEFLNFNLVINGDNNNFYLGKNSFGTILITLNYNNNNVQIGDNFRAVQFEARLHGDNLKIGNNCMSSDNVQIWTDGHSIIDNDTKELLNGELADIQIGNHVWLSHGVRILKKSKIPDNSVVGMNSIVTKPFDKKNIILAGNPAKIIKENINWAQVSPCNYNKKEEYGN